MATCRYCDKDISPNATRCPHCGDPDPHSSYYSPPDTRSPEAIKKDNERNRYMMFAAIPTLICVFYGAIYCINQGITSAEKTKHTGLGDALGNLFGAVVGGLVMGVVGGVIAGGIIGYVLYAFVNLFRKR